MASILTPSRVNKTNYSRVKQLRGAPFMTPQFRWCTRRIKGGTGERCERKEGAGCIKSIIARKAFAASSLHRSSLCSLSSLFRFFGG